MRGAGGDDPSEIEDGYAGAGASDEVHVVLDQKHGAAECLRNGGDALAELERLVIGDAGGGFVEQDDRRPGRDDARDWKSDLREDMRRCMRTGRCD